MKTKKNESGVVFVEAAVVFPVMLLVIFLMIYAGNAYFQKARVEAIVTEIAIDGAAYCADPMIRNVNEGEEGATFGGISVSSLNVYPYRAFDSNGTGDTVGAMQTELEERIEGLGTGYFSGMKPQVKSASAKYKNGFFYSTFEVDVEYKIVFPIRMLGQKENLHITMYSHAAMPVSDTTELIRNVNMVEDYLEQFGITERFEEFKTKLSNAISSVGDWKKK